MASDPKIRGGVQPVRLPVSTPTAPKAAATPAPAKPTSGYGTASSFEPTPTTRGVAAESLGRRVVYGAADDSVGRKQARGAADDSVGRKATNGAADDSVGRKTSTGAADDSVGRKSTNGAADDSVGRGATDDSVGRKNGAADDSVGRGATDDSVGRKNGAADDSVGRGATDDSVGRKTGAADDSVGGLSAMSLAAPEVLVGRYDTDDSLALRNALYHRMETPSFLTEGADVAGQVATFARTQNLSSTQLAQIDTVLKGASAEGAKLLGALLEKAPEALSDPDSHGASTLSNLARLVGQPLNAALVKDTSSAELLTSVLRDIANPNQIVQGDAPTCTVTSMQYELVADEPAEYARLMADLSGPAGKAKMRGGSYLQAEAGDAGARDERPVSSALFQTAAMEFGNGKDMQFDPVAGKSVSPTTGKEQRGLIPAQQTQVLRQLFGVNYESKNFLTEAQGQKALAKLRDYDARGNQNRPIILALDQGSFNHAVTFERVSGQQVYFRDPYGILRSMPEADFGKVVMAVNAPRDLNIV